MRITPMAALSSFNFIGNRKSAERYCGGLWRCNIHAQGLIKVPRRWGVRAVPYALNKAEKIESGLPSRKEVETAVEFGGGGKVAQPNGGKIARTKEKTEQSMKGPRQGFRRD
jgi:hypothetical protein